MQNLWPAQPRLWVQNQDPRYTYSITTALLCADERVWVLLPPLCAAESCLHCVLRVWVLLPVLLPPLCAACVSIVASIVCCVCEYCCLHRVLTGIPWPRQERPQHVELCLLFKLPWLHWYQWSHGNTEIRLWISEYMRYSHPNSSPSWYRLYHSKSFMVKRHFVCDYSACQCLIHNIVDHLIITGSIIVSLHCPYINSFTYFCVLHADQR